MTENKICFVIMPISDQEGYDKGHFNRVYEYIIKPACEKAGFVAMRADEEVKTNYIVVDIIKKILDSEMVICDLSAKNPNVLYELGLRQAFNKKVVLIKDKITSRIFDIQGLRTIDYDSNLRIDEVSKGINQISKTLLDTANSESQEINSLIQLLSISPAELPNKINISQESSLILDSLADISKRLQRLETNNKSRSKSDKPIRVAMGSFEFTIGDSVYNDSDFLGKIVDFNHDSVFIKNEDEITKYFITDPVLRNPYPF